MKATELTLVENSKYMVALATCPLGSPINIPLALPCLAAYLREYGYQTVCIDFNLEFEKSLSSNTKYLLDDVSLWIGMEISPIAERMILEMTPKWANTLLSHRPHLVGLSVNLVNLRTSVLLAKMIKKISPDTVVVLGGPECSYGWQNLIQDENIDFIIIGEGERPLVELIECLKSGADYRKIPSVVWKGCESNQIRPAVNISLDALPFPDYSVFDLSKYANRGIVELPIYASEGCIGNCAFCSRGFLSGEYRCKSPERIISELKSCMNNYKINNFYFVDSLINGNMDQLNSWTKAAVDMQLNIQWRANAIFSPSLATKDLELMFRSGCSKINYGLESGSSIIRRRMKKFSNMPIVERIIRDSYSTGILVSCFVMIGFPGETEDDFQMTVDFLSRNSYYINEVEISLCYITPHTDLEKNKRKYNIDGGGNTWSDPSSTYEVRLERLKKLKNSLIDLGISG